MSTDESTTQWIDGSVNKLFSPGNVGAPKTPGSGKKRTATKSKAFLTPKSTSGRKTPKGKGKSTGKKSKKKKKMTPSKSSPSIRRSVSPGKRHSFNDLQHVGNSSGGAAVNASNLRWAYDLRSHPPSPARSMASPSKPLRITPAVKPDADEFDVDMDVDNAVQELTVKLEAVSGKQVSCNFVSLFLSLPFIVSAARQTRVLSSRILM